MNEQTPVNFSFKTIIIMSWIFKNLPVTKRKEQNQTDRKKTKKKQMKLNLLVNNLFVIIFVHREILASYEDNVTSHPAYISASISRHKNYQQT